MKKIPKSIIFILGIITGIAITGGYYYFSNEVKKENHLPEFWDAEGMYQNYDFPTRQAEDILSDCQNLFLFLIQMAKARFGMVTQERQVSTLIGLKMVTF